MKKYIIGLDIGGTKTSCVIGTKKGRILGKSLFPTETQKGSSQTLKRIIKNIKELLRRLDITLAEVEGMGIGAPGPLDPIKGVILNTPNMPGWNNVCLKEIFSRKFNLPVILDNDANAAALGEKIFGAGKDIGDMFYFTVSTGIGGGLIIGGKVYHGASFDAAEVGHTVVLVDGPKCKCGKRGCLEALASGTAIARKAKEKVKFEPSSLILKLAGNSSSITARIVSQAAEKGDELAKQIFQEAGRFLGIGVANVLNLINPQMVVIGGGVSLAGELLFKPMKESAKKEAFGKTYQVCQIVPSKLKDKVGDLGAVSLVFNKYRRKDGGHS
ncbi:MAG: ROK family protein [Candidatus Omnitrophota bacterium]|nr:ROK family protein [Candidatus Omnitrophota bacterium]